MFGTKLADAGGSLLWGSTRALFFGPPLSGEAKPAGLLESFPVLPPVSRFDVYGGLVRYLTEAGRAIGKDLFVLDYDWRLGVEAAAASLAQLIDRLDPSRPVDLAGFSSGGLVVRCFLSAGGASRVRRTILVGAPQRGSVTTLIGFIEGLRLFPLGKRYRPDELAEVQIIFDLLPHPDEPVVEGDSDPAGLYDLATWEHSPIWKTRSAWSPRLERARLLHQALASVLLPDAFVIGARHVKTPARVKRAGRWLSWPGAASKTCYADGDGTVTLASLLALPSFDAATRCRFAKPRLHQLLCSDIGVHEQIVTLLHAP